MPRIALPAFQDNYIWLITHSDSPTFTCVDPGDAAPVLHYAQTHQQQLTHVLITHHHQDHIGGLQRLLQTFPNIHIYGPADQRIPYLTHQLTAHETLAIDQDTFIILPTPGHTSSHISYYEPNQSWLFCGDTLFSAGCGRVFDGTMRELYQSIQLLRSLPDDTNIYCAHEYTRQNLAFALQLDPDNQAAQTYYTQLCATPSAGSLPSTIALEKRINPFMRTHLRSLQTIASAHGINSTDSFAVFQWLRTAKDNFSR